MCSFLFSPFLISPPASIPLLTPVHTTTLSSVIPTPSQHQHLCYHPNLITFTTTKTSSTSSTANITPSATNSSISTTQAAAECPALSPSWSPLTLQSLLVPSVPAPPPKPLPPTAPPSSMQHRNRKLINVACAPTILTATIIPPTPFTPLLSLPTPQPLTSQPSSATRPSAPPPPPSLPCALLTHARHTTTTFTTSITTHAVTKHAFSSTEQVFSTGISSLTPERRVSRGHQALSLFRRRDAKTEATRSTKCRWESQADCSVGWALAHCHSTTVRPRAGHHSGAGLSLWIFLPCLSFQLSNLCLLPPEFLLPCF